MQCYEDRPSHRISAFPIESDIFEDLDLKTYEKPVDSAPALSSKELQSLKKKFEEFKSNKQVSKSKSPRPIIKSPLSKKTCNISPLTQVKPQPSYKKPLLSLSVSILGKEITENIFDGDYSLDVAKKIFSSAQLTPSYSDLKSLASEIEVNVSNYMFEVASELAKFHKSSKKIQESQVKKKLNNMKPPLLMTARRADEKRVVLGQVSMKLDNKDINFPVKEGENPLKLAEKICETQKISRNHLQDLIKEIRDILDKSNKKFLFRLEFEINGKVADLALHDGDDLTSTAQRFCRENKLGSEYITKIQEVLQKHLNNVI